MIILAITYFFVMLYGLGYMASDLFLCKQSKTFLERILMRVGIGLGVFSVIACILNLIHLPLLWWFFLFPYPAIIIKDWKKLKKPIFRPLHRSNLFIYIVLILFGLTLFMHCKGAFSYPWLEDTDPYGLAASVKYIAEEKTAYDPPFDWSLYIRDRTTRNDPYPPSHAILMSTFYQISDSMIWTLKFFNALIVSLGIIFFYFMVKEFTKNKTIALLSTFVFTMIPSYLSHFIWAHALIVTIFFPLVYCLLKIEKDRKWLIPSCLIMASIPLIQPTQAIKLYILVGVFCLVKFLSNKKLWKSYILLFIIGGLLSLSWWAPVMLGHGGARNIIDESLTGATTESSLLEGLKVIFNPASGSATRAYAFDDFFFAKGDNLINNPVGWGIFISILLIVSFDLCIKNIKKTSARPWLAITVLWFIIMFLLVNSMTFNLPIGLIAFRCWMLLAIPVSILVGATIYHIKLKPRYLTFVVWAVLLMGIFITSGIPKWQINTSMWGTYFGQLSMDEVMGYVKLPQLISKGSRVFDISGFHDPIIAYDMDVCFWCKEELQFGMDILDHSAIEIHQWLNNHNYPFLFIGGKSIGVHKLRYGDSTGYILQEKMYEIQASNLFRAVYQNEGCVLLEVKK